MIILLIKALAVAVSIGAALSTSAPAPRRIVALVRRSSRDRAGSTRPDAA
ncbi:MAG TPA: hypothetical protein VMT54_13520 [Candidatus Cybelea sp.]|nr:hypothetical protein [Candidatus Cybelea sp.]